LKPDEVYWVSGLGVETGDETPIGFVASVEDGGFTGAEAVTGTTDVMTAVVFWLAGQFVTDDGQAVIV
jgi:hypothetical protein